MSKNKWNRKYGTGVICSICKIAIVCGEPTYRRVSGNKDTDCHDDCLLRYFEFNGDSRRAKAIMESGCIA